VLLTSEAVMGDEALTQPEAWAMYDGWLRDDRGSTSPRARNGAAVRSMILLAE
jgi:hypothetical protein